MTLIDRALIDRALIDRALVVCVTVIRRIAPFLLLYCDCEWGTVVKCRRGGEGGGCVAKAIR